MSAPDARMLSKGRLKILRQSLLWLTLIGSVPGGPARTSAQAPPSATTQPTTTAPAGEATVIVPAAEFEQLKGEVRALRAALSQLTATKKPAAPTSAPAGGLEVMRAELLKLRGQLTTLENRIGEVQNDRTYAQERAAIITQLKEEMASEIDPLVPGFSNLLVTGFAFANFQNRENMDSTFGAGVTPIILWKPTDRLFFETEISFGLDEEDTEVELGYAQISYLLNDYLTVGAGKFLLPFGTFWERWHPPWINKMATMPLLYERGLVGESGLGVQLRGGAPVGPTKINYSAYIINGPDFNTNRGSAGQLGFDNNRDNNNNKAVGGRFGFLPIPELEFGYSILSGRVGDSGSRNSGVDTLMQGIDVSYAREFEAIKGRLDLRSEFVWVDTDDVVFTGPFSPFTYDNKRNGWFVQAAYRPTMINAKLGAQINVKDFEFVMRYDQLRQPGPSRLGVDRDQMTFGIDYWLLPNAVIKAAFVVDDAQGGPDQDGFFLQTAIGF